VIDQLAHFLGESFIALMFCGKPNFTSFLQNLLTDCMHTGVNFRNGA
jgi:hypothetical protein